MTRSFVGHWWKLTVTGEQQRCSDDFQDRLLKKTVVGLNRELRPPPIRAAVMP